MAAKEEKDEQQRPPRRTEAGEDLPGRIDLPRDPGRAEEDVFAGDRDTLNEDNPLNFQVVDISGQNLDTTPTGEIPEDEVDVRVAMDTEQVGDTINLTGMQHFTDDDEILEDFEERQRLAAGGAGLTEEMREITHLSPSIAGEDVDAGWQYADQVGDEAVGGSAPTPDQDVVEELGEAAGLTYRDDEALDFGKVLRRDEQRWELDPMSMVEVSGRGSGEDEDISKVENLRTDEDEFLEGGYTDVLEDDDDELDEDELESLEELEEDELDDLDEEDDEDDLAGYDDDEDLEDDEDLDELDEDLEDEDKNSAW